MERQPARTDDEARDRGIDVQGKYLFRGGEKLYLRGVTYRTFAPRAVGNEIPAGIVRWHGRARVERFLRGLVGAVRDEDDALVTYVNFPSTEYLDVACVDFACFNVYLEQRDRLAAYLARLQNLAGDL